MLRSLIPACALVFTASIGCREQGTTRTEPAPPPASAAAAATSTTISAALPATVIDPVCEMEVDPKTAISREHEGQRYWFCSENCRQSFISEPQKYTQKKK